MNTITRRGSPGARGSVPNQEYAQWYEQPGHVDILGIACNSFFHHLYPNWERGSRRQRLQALKRSLAFIGLRRHRLQLTVLIANPFCDFVRVRAEEEKNARCRFEILRNIELLRQLYDDLDAKNSTEYNINGLMSVGMYDCNPYVSVFKAQGTRRGLSPLRQRFMEVGFLFQGRQGRDVPRSIIEAEAQPETWEAVNRHFDVLANRDKSTFFFEWQSPAKIEWSFKAPKNARYDVFLCYNHGDAERVSAIEGELRRAGISCWFDRSRLHGGEPWAQGIEDAIRQVRTMAVFLGPEGDGRWQEMEIRLGIAMCASRNLKIIPVILPGVRGEPEVRRIIDGFQRIDLRRGQTAIQELIEALRS